MSRIFHPILYLLACATRQELARQVQYLKVENEVLRARLPKAVRVTPAERRRLVRASRGLGKAIRELVTIVTPATFLKWVNQEGKPAAAKQSQRKPGRPRTPDDVRALVLRLARENTWGYTKFCP